MATFSPTLTWCSRNTIIMLINAAILMKFFVMQSSLLCITGEGGRFSLRIVSRPTIHGGPFRGKNSHKALRIRKEEETIHYTFPVALLWILSDQALASCYDLLVGRVNVENWVHPRIFISPVLSAIVAPTPFKLRSLFSSVFFLFFIFFYFFFRSFCASAYIDVSLRRS